MQYSPYLPDLRTTQCSRDQVWKVGEAVPGAWPVRGHNWGQQPLHDLNIAVTRGWVKPGNPITSSSMLPETRWGRHQCSVGGYVSVRVRGVMTPDVTTGTGRRPPMV